MKKDIPANSALCDLSRIFGPAANVPADRESLRREAIRAGQRIYRKTMHGKLKLTDDA